MVYDFNLLNLLDRGVKQKKYDCYRLIWLINFIKLFNNVLISWTFFLSQFPRKCVFFLRDAKYKDRYIFMAIYMFYSNFHIFRKSAVIDKHI